MTEEKGRNRGYIEAVKMAKGDVLLFLNGSIFYPPAQLDSFLKPILHGQSQVVLNNLNPSFVARRLKQWPDSFTLWRQVFNDAIGYTDLNIDSLLSFPHAYTTKVIQSIGYASLENLVVAHMRILNQGWSISRHFSINSTFPGDLLTPEQSYYKMPLTNTKRENMLNHFEALYEWQLVQGVRGNYHDGGRRRDIVNAIKLNNNLPDFASVSKGSGMISSIYKGKQISVIIPARNEERTIAAVIKEARKIEPLEIIVIVNGSTDKTEIIAKYLGATIITFPDPLGHDVGRAIGAREAKGDILLFIVADIPIPASKLHRYSEAVSNGIDVALNDSDQHFSAIHPEIEKKRGPAQNTLHLFGVNLFFCMIAKHGSILLSFSTSCF